MELLLDLDAAPGRSLRRRAEHALREAVRDGRLAPGARLPSTRALAAQLGVSRGVVVEAYAQLAAEGYLVTRRGGGTTVSTAPAGGGTPAGNRRVASGNSGQTGSSRDGAGVLVPVVELPRAKPRTPDAKHKHDLRPALPALDGFPRGAWVAALGRVARSLPDERLGYPDPAGESELRATLAAYLGRVRGVRAEPGQIVVTGGLRQGLALLWETLAAAGVARVAVERPGWRGWGETAAAAGLAVVPLAVDRDGAVVEGIDALAVGAAGVAPAHQYPTGAVLSPGRRARLVAWARRTGAVLVEDDYDAEFRYDRKPVGALQGLAPDVVVYGGSVSKTLVPAVRLGWLALPRPLAEPVAEAQRLRGGTPTPLDQLALAELIERGELDRHLRRQRRRYARRRDALLAALARELPEVAVEGVAAGLHALLRLPAGLDERAVLRAAGEHGVALTGLGHGAPALVVGYANLAEEAAGPAVAALARAVRAAGATGRRAGSTRGPADWVR